MRSAIAKPSSLLHGIQIKRVEDLDLFKFTDALQSRMEELLEKKKANAIAPENKNSNPLANSIAFLPILMLC